MSDQRDGGIAWTDQTWNPVRGCTRVSAGCVHCYAETMAARFAGPGEAYEGTITDGRWSGTIKLVSEHLADPLRWKRPRRVFVNSMSDLFHDGVPDEYIAAVFGVMAASPRHTFQVLTKRPERALRWFTELPTWSGRQPADLALADYCMEFARGASTNARAEGGYGMTPWPLPNVWLGVSVENQQATSRIAPLLACPAAVRFLSCEPLIGKIVLPASAKELDWCIIGGESGPGARHCHSDWVDQLLTDCDMHGITPFVKQLGSVQAKHRQLKHSKGGDPSEWPVHMQRQQFPVRA